MKRTRPPLVAAALWTAVMERAGNRCECKGACGSKHTDRDKKPGRCETANGDYVTKIGYVVLLATPRDPINEGCFAKAAALPARRLIALCPPCQAGVKRILARAEKALPPQMEGLFGEEDVGAA